MKKYKIKGENIEIVLKKLSNYLKIDKEKIDYKIINQKKNMLGKIINVEVEVSVSEKEEIEKKEETNEIKKEKIQIEDVVKIEIKKDGIYLKINKMIYETEISIKNIEDEITRREIKEIEKSRIEIALNDKIDQFVKIAEYDKNYYIDAKVKLQVIKKGLEIKMEIIPPKRGRDITRNQIEIELKKQGVIYGIKDDLIDQIVKNKYYNQIFVIARGQFPKKGKDAEISYFFDIEQNINFEEDKKGQVDYKNMGLLNNVSSGEILAEKEPAKKGLDGIDIFGNRILAEMGKDKFFLKSKKVKLSDDKKKLISMIDGHVTLTNNKVTVTPIKIVPQDVDYSTGNIDFIGTVFVRGNIIGGFKVKAKGDIIVDGIVEDAILESEANISVRNGIIGKLDGKGIIKAKGQVKSKYLENIKVISDETVYVKENIINSIVWAKEAVIMESKKGTITGGEIIAGEKIIAPIIGSILSNKTILSVGVYPEYQVEKELLYNEIEKLKKEIEKYESEIHGLKRLNLNGKMTQDKMKIFLATTRELLGKKTLLEFKTEKIEKITEMIENENLGKIHVLDKIYSGVFLKIGNRVLKVKDDLQNVTFYLGEKKLKIKLMPCEIGG